MRCPNLEPAVVFLPDVAIARYTSARGESHGGPLALLGGSTKSCPSKDVSTVIYRPLGSLGGFLREE